MNLDHAFTMLGAWPLLGSMAGAFVPLLITVYVIARWRSYREGGASDPHLGLKLAFSVFRWVGLQLVLIGLVVLAFAAFGADDDRSTALRVAAALIVPGLLILAGNEVAYRGTNHREHPAVGRMVAGASMVQTGVVATVALVIACQVSFAKEIESDVPRIAWAAAVVYGVAWIAQARILWTRS